MTSGIIIKETDILTLLIVVLIYFFTIWLPLVIIPIYMIIQGILINEISTVVIAISIVTISIASIFTFPLILRLFNIYKDKAIISDVTVQIFVQNELYLELIWSSIKKIMIIEETFKTWKFDDISAREIKKNGYYLIFFNSHKKEIRLWCCFNLWNQKRIISALKYFANKYSIIVEESINDEFISNQSKACEGIFEFRKQILKKERKSYRILSKILSLDKKV